MSVPSASAVSSANASALRIALSHLSDALTYTTDANTNIQTNKKLWNQYAKQYSQKQQPGQGSTSETASATKSPDATHSDWVLEMASHVSRGAADLEFLGDEWSDTPSLEQSLNEFLMPYLGNSKSLSQHTWREAKELEQRSAAAAESATTANYSVVPAVSYLPPSSIQELSSTFPVQSLTVAEIGVGGGRIASRTYRHVKQLFTFDIAEEMLKQAKASIAAQYIKEQPARVVASDPAASASSSSPAADEPTNVSYNLLTNAPQFPSRFHSTCDFVYCFDVMPHIDLHTIYAYFKTVKQLLKPNPSSTGDQTRPRPRVLFHTANICAPLGFERFAKQTEPTAGGFHFLSPDIIRQLATQTGFRIIQESKHAFSQQDKEAATTAGNLEEMQQRLKNIYYQRDFMFVMEVI